MIFRMCLSEFFLNFMSYYLYLFRPTWAGSFNTQLYGNLLMDLTKQTELNLSRLNDKLSEQEQWEHCGIIIWTLCFIAVVVVIHIFYSYC